jgi:hypothetical protein
VQGRTELPPDLLRISPPIQQRWIQNPAWPCLATAPRHLGANHDDRVVFITHRKQYSGQPVIRTDVGMGALPVRSSAQS